MICLVDFDNGRYGVIYLVCAASAVKTYKLTTAERWGKSRNNRSVMPFDVLGRTRVTMIRRTSRYFGRRSKSCKTNRDGDRILQLLFVNEEFLVIACHQRAMNTSLSFVHTARR